VSPATAAFGNPSPKMQQNFEHLFIRINLKHDLEILFMRIKVLKYHPTQSGSELTASPYPDELHGLPPQPGLSSPLT